MLNPSRAGWVIALYFGIQMLDGWVITPYVQRLRTIAAAAGDDHHLAGGAKALAGAHRVGAGDADSGGDRL